MERIGEARAAALMQQQRAQLQVQVQQGMSPAQMATAFGAPEHAVASAAAAKPRAAGLPPTPPTSSSFGGQRGGDVSMEDAPSAAARKAAAGPPAHRRSRSDVPFSGYFSPSSLPQPKTEAGGWGHHDGANGGTSDDLFSSYLNLEGMEGLNSSPDSSLKADSSENGSEEYATDSHGAAGIRWADGSAGVKRSAAGEPAMAGRHARSLSMDSQLMGRLNFSSTGGASNGGAGSMFSLEFGSGEFTPAEMKKIMADEKLAEMALADPKRVKRVLANRQSAARSKERKMRYIVELEQKVHVLQTEATTLSAQLTLLQRDSSGMATQNNELRFRLQAMEQQAQLRDALNEALTGEVQRMKIATAEQHGVGDSCSSNGMAQQQAQMFQHLQQQQQQQATPIPFYQLQQQQQQQQQQNGTANNHESRE